MEQAFGRISGKLSTQVRDALFPVSVGLRSLFGFSFRFLEFKLCSPVEYWNLCFPKSHIPVSMSFRCCKVIGICYQSLPWQKDFFLQSLNRPVFQRCSPLDLELCDWLVLLEGLDMCFVIIEAGMINTNCQLDSFNWQGTNHQHCRCHWNPPCQKWLKPHTSWSWRHGLVAEGHLARAR